MAGHGLWARPRTPRTAADRVRRLTRRLALLVVGSLSLWSCGGVGRSLGPTPHGYVFQAHVLTNQLYLPSPLVLPGQFPTATALTVTVYTSNGHPVDGVPVLVQLAGSQCDGVVTLSASQAVTHGGQASVRVTSARTSGACRLAVQVDNVTQALWVAVAATPDPRGGW
jgi:hypothetical protein